MAEYHVENFGCRTNQADGDAIAAAMDALAAVRSEDIPSADVVIVNTCTVTAEADRDARAYIRRAHRANPGSRIVVTGCYAQRAPQEIAGLPGVFAVVGNSHKDKVASVALAGMFSEEVPRSRPPNSAVILSEVGSPTCDFCALGWEAKDLASHRQTAGPSTPSASPRRPDPGRDDKVVCRDFILDNMSSQTSSASSASAGFIPLAALGTVAPSREISPFILTGDIFAHSDFQLPPLSASTVRHLQEPAAPHRTRPPLKIQDGCGNRCSFCVIPSTRGNSRSLAKQSVLDAVREFVDAGGKEMVLSGINLGRWGRDLMPQLRFDNLLAEIFETTSLPRLRISSVEPMDWTEELIALFARWSAGEHPSLARHAHVPLQSGSDAVLRRMHRRYRPWHYAERVAAMRAASPDAAIGADVMVGFPNETDAEFQESYDFIAAQPFTYLHLFPFSARPGTAAWDSHRENPVPGAAVKERMAVLRALIDEKNLAFRSRFIGKQLSAVTLVSSEAVAASGHTSALTDNFLPLELDRSYRPNEMLSVQIAGLTATGLRGSVTESSDPVLCLNRT